MECQPGYGLVAGECRPCKDEQCEVCNGRHGGLFHNNTQLVMILQACQLGFGCALRQPQLCRRGGLCQHGVAMRSIMLAFLALAIAMQEICGSAHNAGNVSRRVIALNASLPH